MSGLKGFLISFTIIFSLTGCGELNHYKYEIFNENKNGCTFICSKTLYEYEKPKYPNLKFEFDNSTDRYCISKDEYIKLKVFNIKEKYYVKKLETVIKTCICNSKVKR